MVVHQPTEPEPILHDHEWRCGVFDQANTPRLALVCVRRYSVIGFSKVVGRVANWGLNLLLGYRVIFSVCNTTVQIWLRVLNAMLTSRLIPKLSVIISRSNTDTSPRVVATTATSSLGSRAGIQRCNEPSWPGYRCFVMDRLASGVGSGFQ
ncbi:uncharacterized protein HBSAL_13105 (plasmid) [Halobacterium salinarum]|uniref:Uncharacterized protein n=1 Tax=Halobacterium salinarum (strain ATCC 33171 / DSM 3754 / JCM 8978 / NBRC 102687 / NCIMB 764 / 91-R6) TaxID=2597657 RepID=A0A4D6GWP9_HALS9|nr:uncharacterized protein HBSAL_13105 [Halobacterium salinarum]